MSSLYFCPACGDLFQFGVILGSNDYQCKRCNKKFDGTWFSQNKSLYTIYSKSSLFGPPKDVDEEMNKMLKTPINKVKTNTVSRICKICQYTKMVMTILPSRSAYKGPKTIQYLCSKCNSKETEIA